ncbi:VIT domain-containing protein [Bacteroides sp. 519]|uniref:VIT domain-containing protein n=1 Tax=Bacteroides sp. 519 TaxID=2302937 RepID=UPI0013D2DD72|nr:VIT domain-containing protein [Bacteroides sp. 519]
MKPYLVKLIICMAIIANSTYAQIPVLNVNNKNSAEVYLQSLDIQVEVTGNVALTKFTMTFKNRTSKVLEGELLFPLPNGVTASHYALDINGKMREAVPVEKAKATQVFEEIVHRRVDPGLLERVEGNNFRTRIYPIPAHGTRTISIGYEEELPIEGNSLCYNLPMDYKEAIENFSLKATVLQGSVKPQTDKANELVFDKAGTNYTAAFSRKNYKPERSVTFSLPIQKEIPMVSMQSASGSYYFVASCFPEKKVRTKQWSNHIGIIWDASLSGLKRDTKKDLEVIQQIVTETKDLTVSLYLLNNKFTKSGTYKITNGNWDDLKKALESVIYDGGTNYSAVRTATLPDKEFLLFSDGLSTLSNADFFPKDQKVMWPRVRQNDSNKSIHCIVSAAVADYSALKLIAAQTNGKFINLNSLSATQLKEELTTETLHFLGVEKTDNIKEVYPSVATPVRNNFSIAGITDVPQTQLVLLFGYGNKVEKRVLVSLNANQANREGNIHRIWAQKKINELDMAYEQNKEELTELGKQFGIVTRNTSLIVLETIEDYIQYDIVPPFELQDEYYRRMKERSAQQVQTRTSLLNNAIAEANVLQEWWNRDIKKQKSKYPVPDSENEHRQQEVPEILDVVEYQEEMREISSDELADMAFADVAFEEEIIPMAMTKMVSEPSQPQIRITPLKQDSEYMKSLKGKADEDYAVYLRLREEYINTPTFYFDMADWFYKLNDKEKALRILTSIAELEVENASLFRLLGYRLKEYNEYELEIYICNKVIQWRPMEPQSYRDYALALYDSGRQQEALDTLYSVLTQSYATNIESKSCGIEEVVVTELNRILNKNTKLKSSGIEKQLIAPMPVDIRVVINWNMDNTDIDLHVTDPNNETCFYGYRETKIGGRISRDITRGYGPEQFMLKKAIKGKYEVFVNYFGDSQVKASGPSTIMLEIFTKYSDKEEKREVVCVQLSKEQKATQNGLLKVAEFEF